MSDWSKIVGSDIADFTTRWRRPLMGAALGGLGGYGAGMLGSTLGASGTLGSAGSMAMLGTLAGGAAGYSRDQRKREAEKAARDAARQQADKDQAGDELIDIINPYLPGDPGEQPPIAVEPPIDPVTGDPTAPPTAPVDPVSPDAPVTLPGDLQPTPDTPLDLSGKAGADMEEILGLAGSTREEQLALWNQQQAMREQYRQQLAETLQAQMDRQFDEARPEIYEDLNRRGLLRSTATGEALAKERGRLAAGVNEQLALQAIQDQYGALGGLDAIQGQYQQAQQGALGRRFSLEDWARQMEASQKLGQAVSPIQPYAGGGKGGMQDLQTGMSVASLGTAMGGKR